VAELTDAAITKAVRAYVHARDYETRRMQAEHIGFLTHELRNPLMVAISAADLLSCNGLSRDELRTIFEPPTRKQGTGLGLAITRRVLEVQSGTIHAESPGPTGCHSGSRCRAVRDAADWCASSAVAAIGRRGAVGAPARH
jgi:signal transduction histidine kinase